MSESGVLSKEANPYVSVIIPCWNEEENLENGVLDEVFEHLVKQPYHWEAIVVDDGSTDNSKDFIQRFIGNKRNFILLCIPHGGKPAALWAGVRAAKGDIFLLTDMDQSTPIGELDKLLPWYDHGFDVVIGSRGLAREGFPLVRRLGSYVFRCLRRSLLLPDIDDTQCGFKSLRRNLACDFFPRLQYFAQATSPTGWRVSAYDVELLYVLERAGCRVKEVLVEWRNRDVSKAKGQRGELSRYIFESVEMAREVMRVRRNEAKGLYDDLNIVK